MHEVEKSKLVAHDVMTDPKKKSLGTKIKELFSGNPEEKALDHEKELIRREQEQ